MKKNKNTEFYLLRKKDLSEGDLFITDYTKTKQSKNNVKNILYYINIPFSTSSGGICWAAMYSSYTWVSTQNKG